MDNVRILRILDRDKNYKGTVEEFDTLFKMIMEIENDAFTSIVSSVVTKAVIGDCLEEDLEFRQEVLSCDSYTELSVRLNPLLMEDYKEQWKSEEFRANEKARYERAKNRGRGKDEKVVARFHSEKKH